MEIGPVQRPDLHTHTTASDGDLAPEELVARAAAAGVDWLAVTDHDTVHGLETAATAARHHGLRLVTGVEISSRWEGREIHVVGLDLDPAAPVLVAGLQHQQRVRWKRGEAIARRLSERGVDGADAVLTNRDTASAPTRGDFARWLAEQGYARDRQKAFRRYLAHGKPAFVRPEWVDLAGAIEWVHGAGGVAVLAHPWAYRFTGAWRRRLLDAFAEAGGRAVEVVTTTTPPSQIREMAGMAVRRGLFASLGSDFHAPGMGAEPGRLAPLPEGNLPVWEAFAEAGRGNGSSSTVSDAGHGGIRPR